MKKNQFVFNSFDCYNVGNKQNLVLSSVLQNIINVWVFCTFIPPIYTLSLAGNIIVYKPSQGTNRKNYSYKKQQQRLGFRLWREKKQPFHPSLPLYDGLSPSFNRKWTDLIRRRWASKCSFSSRLIDYSLKSVWSINGKHWIFPWLGKFKKLKEKDKNKKCMNLIWKENQKIHQIIIFMHISSSISLCVFYFLRNEEKLVALLVHSSFRWVATSGIRNSSVATSSIS